MGTLFFLTPKNLMREKWTFWSGLVRCLVCSKFQAKRKSWKSNLIKFILSNPCVIVLVVLQVWYLLLRNANLRVWDVKIFINLRNYYVFLMTWSFSCYIFRNMKRFLQLPLTSFPKRFFFHFFYREFSPLFHRIFFCFRIKKFSRSWTD